MSEPNRSPQPHAAEHFAGELDLSALGDIPDPIAPKKATRAPELGPGLDRVQDRLRAEPHALTRGEVKRRRLVALAVSVVWLGSFIATFGMRTGLESTMGPLVGHILAPAALGVIALYMAIARGRLGLGPRAEWLVGITVVAPAAFAALAALTATTFDSHADGIAFHAFACGGFAVVLGTIPMIAAIYGLRRVCVTAAPWRSALIGVGIGLASVSVLGMHCSSADGLHVLAGHVTPVLVLALLATFVVRRFARAD